MDVATDRKTAGKSRQMGWWRQLRLRWQGSRKRAVLAAITACRLERHEQEQRDDELATKIMELLNEAKKAIDHGNIQAGWACFLAARRMQILTASQARIFAESIALREEAEELSDWRRNAIRQLLNSEQQEKLEYQRLYVAYEIRDQARQDTYRKVEILREQLFVLGLMLIAAVIGLLVMAVKWPVVLVQEPPDRIPREIVFYVALFGALGGSLSAIQWVIKASTTASGIPERRMHGPAVYMRPVFGIAAALAVFPFLVGGILPVELKNYALVFSVALVAGFTERLISYAVRTVTTGEGQGNPVSAARRVQE
jgi:hypothetical protein